MEITIIPARREMHEQLKQLHLAVTAIPGGLIRQPFEITGEYIDGVLRSCTEHGLMLVAEDGNRIAGEIHAHTPPLHAFRHLLSDLTIVVHPDYQGKGIGRKLFTRFLEIVEKEFPRILRVELYVRRHNTKNVRFYTSLGFRIEGTHEQKIYAGPGVYETPLSMVWFNPGYKPE
jgi:putative acetyltransferase